MKPKTLILLLVAVSCGLVAMILVAKLTAKTETDRVLYLVSNTDMNQGDKISNIDTQFHEQEFIPGTQPPKALTKLDVQSKPGTVLGKILVRPLARGEAITERHVKDDSIADKLKPGERAVSIPVKMDTALTGFALPGNRVDLVATYNDGPKTVAKTFLQNVQVLAVNVETTRPEATTTVTAPTTVTLSVKAKDAEKVTWATKQAQYITLTLRNLTDTQNLKMGPGTISLGGDSANGSKEDELEPSEKKAVLVAKQNIRADEAISDPNSLFEVKQFPKEFVTGDYLESLTDPIFLQQNLRAKIELKKGEFVTRRFLGATSVVAQAQPTELTQVIINGTEQKIYKFDWDSSHGRWILRGGTGGTGGTPDVSSTPSPSTPSPMPGTPARCGRAPQGTNVITATGPACLRPFRGWPVARIFFQRRVGWGDGPPHPGTIKELWWVLTTHPTLARRGERMHRTNRVTRVPLGALLLLGFFYSGAGSRAWGLPDEAPPPKTVTRPVDVFVNGVVQVQMSRRPDEKEPPTIVSVINNNQNIVRALPGVGRTITLTGLAPGTAVLTLTAEDKREEQITVNVLVDTEALKKLLRDTVPTAAVTPMAGAGNMLILKGTVAHAEDVNLVLSIAASALGSAGPANIINALTVGGVQQVQLDVVVAEVAREELRRMSVDFWDAGQNHQITSSPGGAIAEPEPSTGITGSIPPGGTLGPLVFVNEIGSPNGTASNTFLSIYNSRQAIFGFIQALRTNNLAKILAEPHLVTLSGKPASFLSGGEQATPQVNGFAVTGVTFIPFGTRLQFLPVVLGNGKIYMEIEPEISLLDQSAGTVIQGSPVPGRSTRPVRTSVILEDGQTFAVGGLIQNQVSASITKVPVLGDLPFLGALFSSKEYDETETELVILVTPHLVDPMDCAHVPHYLPGQETRSPDDFELYLENILEAPRGSREVNQHNKYVPAYKNGPTAQQYPCLSAASGPNIGCPGCNGGGPVPGSGTPIPHGYIQDPGPVPPHPAANIVVQEQPPASNVIVQELPPAVPSSGVQPVGASVSDAPAGGSMPQPQSNAAQPANLPPVSAVPLTPAAPR